MTEAPARSAWALMTSGPFSRLWRAGLISSTGDWVSILATLSIAEELAGGRGIVLALTSRILPGMFFAAIGGVIADRLNRKYVMMTVEVGRAALVLSLAFAGSIAYLVVVNLLLEALTLVFQPAKEATVPSLVQRNEIVRANSLSLSASYGTFPLGAALFLLIAPLAPHFTLWGFLPGTHEGLAFLVDACTYSISALVLSTIPSMRRELPESRKSNGRFNIVAVLGDIRDGALFVVRNKRVRSVVAAMTFGLAGGGIIIVLGKPYSLDVLHAGDSGWPALLTAFGLGAAAGIVLVTVFGPRLIHKDVSFAIALLVTGFALAAAGFIKTILGGIGWISLMGFGAGSTYVLGFAHLHEAVTDEIRGRTFAALFSLMRIGLLTSMMLALPLAGIFDGVLPGLLSDGSRVVMVLGGFLIFSSGSITLWTLRGLIRDVIRSTKRPEVEAATEAFRSYRKAARGADPERTLEIDVVKIYPLAPGEDQ
ncbi:MAG: MFS transporter, partial [Acidimicrobiia bacterium]|nr:MFS transporter [Acidimicrobiia bacterium]